MTGHLIDWLIQILQIPYRLAYIRRLIALSLCDIVNMEVYCYLVMQLTQNVGIHNTVGYRIMLLYGKECS